MPADINITTVSQEVVELRLTGTIEVRSMRRVGNVGAGDCANHRNGVVYVIVSPDGPLKEFLHLDLPILEYGRSGIGALGWSRNVCSDDGESGCGGG